MPTSADDGAKGLPPPIAITDGTRGLTIAELQVECRRYGLAATGTLTTLQRRLRKHRENETEKEKRAVQTDGAVAEESVRRLRRGPVQHSDRETSRVEARDAGKASVAKGELDAADPLRRGVKATREKAEESLPLPVRESTRVRRKSSETEDSDESPVRETTRRRKARHRSWGRYADADASPVRETGRRRRARRRSGERYEDRSGGRYTDSGESPARERRRRNGARRHSGARETDSDASPVRPSRQRRGARRRSEGRREERSWGRSRERSREREGERSWRRESRRPGLETQMRIVRFWGVTTYSGGDSAGARRFIEQVEAGRQVMPMPERDLMEHLLLMLDGPARRWYADNRARCNTWERFAAALMYRFGGAATNQRVREEARARRQGPEENASAYLASAREYYARISPPWRLEDQLDYAYNGLWPELKRVVPRSHFSTFEDMESLVTEYEAALILSRQPAPPPSTEPPVYPELQWEQPVRRGRAAEYTAGGTREDRAGEGRTGNRRDDAESVEPARERKPAGAGRDDSAHRGSRTDTWGSAPGSRRDTSQPRGSGVDRERARTSRDRSRERSRPRDVESRRRGSASRPRSDSGGHRERSRDRESVADLAAMMRDLVASVKKLATAPARGGTRPQRPRGREERPRVATRTRQGPGPCFACGETGHLARECPRVTRPSQNAAAAGNAERRG